MWAATTTAWVEGEVEAGGSHSTPRASIRRPTKTRAAACKNRHVLTIANGLQCVLAPTRTRIVSAYVSHCARFCRTARVTTADQAPVTVCAVRVLTARTAGAVRQRHHHCSRPHPRRHHLLCHRVRLRLHPRLRPLPLLYPLPIWMKGCWNARIRSGGGQRSNAWRIPMIRAATGGS